MFAVRHPNKVAGLVLLEPLAHNVFARQSFGSHGMCIMNVDITHWFRPAQ